MMNCDRCKQYMCEYSDAELNDPIRTQVEEHVQHCHACAEELRLWEESAQLIRTATFDMPLQAPKSKLSARVMDRIYEDESWRMPIAAKAYHWSIHFRRGMVACLSFLLALFMVSFIAAAIYQAHPEQDISGLSVPVTATADLRTGSGDGIKQINALVASISDPPVLGIEVVPQDPNYYLALSLLGMASILLIMNWLARVRQ